MSGQTPSDLGMTTDSSSAYSRAAFQSLLKPRDGEIWVTSKSQQYEPPNQKDPKPKVFVQADFSFQNLPGSFLETPGNQEIRGEPAARAHKMRIAPHIAIIIYWDRDKQGNSRIEVGRYDPLLEDA